MLALSNMGILDIFFPKRCVSCSKFGKYVCDTCLAELKPITNFICPMCERASFDGKTHPGCRTRYSLDGLTSFYRYEGPVKAAIKRLKYKPYISELGIILLISILSSIESNEFSDFVVIPVPLHPKRERNRGFNQAALIGRELASRFNLQFNEKLIKRVKNTKPQVELKGDDRRKNIQDAFAVSPNYTLDAKRYVLLIDDVWTTGSTMRACANVLKRAGAKRVWAITIAR